MNSTETEEVISKARIEMHLKRASEGYGLTNHVGKSKVWESFFDIYHHGKRIPDVVACKECKKVYTFKVADGVHSLIRHKCFLKHVKVLLILLMQLGNPTIKLSLA